MHIEVVEYEHPDAQKLIAEVQQEYVRIYGFPDLSPVDPAQFRAPAGEFLLGHVDGRPVATGAWRAVDHAGPQLRGAEIKRMYVVPELRGRGLSRRMLGELERRAAAAGHPRILLETGRHQPEAIGLYRSAGYAEIPPFGPYEGLPLSVCFAKEL